MLTPLTEIISSIPNSAQPFTGQPPPAPRFLFLNAKGEALFTPCSYATRHIASRSPTSVQPVPGGISAQVIIPLTEDAVWRQTFDIVPPLVPPSRVLVIAPHPDDETLGAGGLIAALRRRGCAVTVVAVTDGENAYATSPAERVQLGKARAREQQEALAELAVPASAIQRLHLPDSGLAAVEEELTRLLLAIAPEDTTLIAPWSGDFHPDHEACARAAARVAALRALPLLSYFFWTWHRGAPGQLAALRLRRFPLCREAMDAKARALSRHRSQLQREDGEPILPGHLLGPAQWPFEIFCVP